MCFTLIGLNVHLIDAIFAELKSFDGIARKPRVSPKMSKSTKNLYT